MMRVETSHISNVIEVATKAQFTPCRLLVKWPKEFRVDPIQNGHHFSIRNQIVLFQIISYVFGDYNNFVTRSEIHALKYLVKHDQSP